MGLQGLLTVDIADGPLISVRSPKAPMRREAMSFASIGGDVRIDGAVPLTASVWGSTVLVQPSDGTAGIIPVGEKPFFFDQTDYMFELVFPHGTGEARLFSPVATWCDRCIWNPDEANPRLNLPVNFGNDLGDFELVFEWRESEGDDWRSLTFKGRVFSTKLDIGNHVPVMMEEVQRRFDWMRLDLLRSTLWDWSRDDARDGNLQTWLAVFREVRTELSNSFRELTRRHRRRLTPIDYRVRADRIRRIRPRMEERIAERLKDRPDARFTVTRKHLDVDTPENRYMKHLLTSCIKTLAEIGERIGPVERISEVFKDRLQEWEDEWSTLLNHPFWRGIGGFRGLRKESLVLSQDPLYARTRRNWIYLQQGVSLLDRDLRGGLQNVAQLYEIWCLVQLDRFVADHPDWESDESRSIPFDREDDDFENDEWRIGTVKLAYSHASVDGVKLDLLFQPTAGREPDHRYWDGMMSLPERQCPDLVLRLHRDDLPGHPVFTWIFDAKYRVAVDKKGEPVGAPRDAIDGMHRYRDAILWASTSRGDDRLTRESLGAFVLYPGTESVATGSRQFKSVDEVNIGAFSLRPDETASDSTVIAGTSLEEKLKDLLKVDGFDEDKPWRLGETHRHYDVVPRVRQGIGDETLRCAIRSSMASEEYWQTCRLYRLPVEEEAKVYAPARSWGWIVPTGADGTPYGRFPIRDSATLRRDEIVQIYRNQGIPIEDDAAKADRLYRLFWLDEPLPVTKQRPLPEGMVVDIE